VRSHRIPRLLLISSLSLATAASLLLQARPAKADLSFVIDEQGTDVVMKTIGALASLPTSPALQLSNAGCSTGLDYTNNPTIPNGSLCIGPTTPNNVDLYTITGSVGFSTIQNLIQTELVGNHTAGEFVGLCLDCSTDPSFPMGLFFGIDASYVPTTPILTSGILPGKSFADFGITGPGLLGSWTLGGTSEKIHFVAVPAPLPLLGAGASLGWARQLRRRIRHQIAPPSS